MKYDYLVVGAGIAGLTASVILAQAGFRVALIERSEHIGPVMRGFSRKARFFDSGFHYTGGMAGNDVLDRFFRYLHIDHELTPEPLDENGFDVFHCTEREFVFPFPYGHGRIKEAFDQAFPHDRDATERYFRQVSDIYEAQPYIDLDAPLLRRDWLIDAQTTSLKDVLDGLTDNRLLKSVLSMHCLLHGASPDEVSFFCHACVVAPYYNSANRIRGGGRQIVHAFDTRIARLGIDVFTGRSVEKMNFTAAGALSGVSLEDGEAIEGDNCLSTVQPSQVLAMIPGPQFRPAYRKRLEAFEETPSAYILYGLTDAPDSPFTRQNHFLFASERFPLLGPSVPIEDRPVYVAQGGNDAQETATFTALCPALLSEVADWSDSTTGRRSEAYRRHKTNVAALLQRRLDAVFDGLNEHTTFTETATPLTLRDYGGNTSGSLYGIKHRFDQHDLLPITRNRHLTLAGQGVAPPGLLGAMVSAFVAAGSILGHDRIREELKRCR
jgi:all-trans-retinol 13,14-reductase